MNDYEYRMIGRVVYNLKRIYNSNDWTDVFDLSYESSEILKDLMLKRDVKKDVHKWMVDQKILRK